MALTIVSDPASASANAYADEVFAVAYFESRLYSSTWENSPQETRKAALIQATRLLDSLVDWKGSVKAEDQPLAWPRQQVQQRDRPLGTYLDPDAAAFPTFLREVCCEIAHDILVEDRLTDSDTGLGSLRVDSISMTFNESDRKDIFSDTTRLLIGNYGNVRRKNASVVKLVRA